MFEALPKWSPVLFGLFFRMASCILFLNIARGSQTSSGPNGSWHKLGFSCTYLSKQTYQKNICKKGYICVIHSFYFEHNSNWCGSPLYSRWQLFQQILCRHLHIYKRRIIYLFFTRPLRLWHNSRLDNSKRARCFSPPCNSFLSLASGRGRGVGGGGGK